jgi:hypothetical protein
MLLQRSSEKVHLSLTLRMGKKDIFHRLGLHLVCTGPDDQSSFIDRVKGHVQ